jgi:energy-coupling factor transporter ATP-binding protein EcfA2
MTENNRTPTQAEQLVSLTADVELWHTPEGEAFATIPASDGHKEHWQIQSKSFRDVLRQRFFDRTAKVPANQALLDAIGLIEGRAEFQGECYPAPLRVAEMDGKLYIDLCDPLWQAVEIDAAGWRVVANPPVRFRRSRGMTALPMPEAGGSVEALRPFVNGDAETFVLVVAWLIQALHPTGPYMVLVLLGEQGSGKSFLARLLRSLIDPSTMPLRSLPREERDLAIAATNGYVLAIDNISGLSVWLSDGICRLSTGGGLAARKLYTDQDEVFLGAIRPVILNGIEGAATRADLLDRSVLVTLDSIADDARRNEREMHAAFEEVVPGILGGLMDAAVAALANRDKVEINLPRMADAAAWIVAAEPVLPWEAGAFLNAYAGNRREAVAIALDADTVGTLILRLMENKAKWTGSATSLMADLEVLLGEHAKRPPDWPGNARVLAGRVFRLAPALRARGIVASRVFGQHTRMISLENTDGWQGRTNDARTTQGRRKDDARIGPEDPISSSPNVANDARDAKIPPSSVDPFEKEREREGRNSCVSCALASSTPCREPGSDDERLPEGAS